VSALLLLLTLSSAPQGDRPPEPSADQVPEVEEHVTVVATTRAGRRIDDEPMRVEVLEREEIEEKMLMTPGDIVMLLNEMGGMRVQATSPALGAASIRIQGMRGRYTRVLADGLPLFGEVRGLGLLQVPPMDLGQVEVVKGVASALYGAGALGGVINVLSRRPSDAPEREFLVNQSTRGATDAVAYFAAPWSAAWSGSLLVGGHWQATGDVDDDGWADLARYERVVVRPRLFRDSGKGSTLFATVGLGYEDREGGTVDGRVLPVTGQPYFEALETRRVDAGFAGQFLVGGRYLAAVRFAAARQSHDHRFGDLGERDRHDTVFGEASLRGSAGRHTWIAGLALDGDAYTADDVRGVGHSFTVPGVFVQHDVAWSPSVAMSSSGRIDRHNRYGTFFSPRVSVLARRGGWTSRLSAGAGFVGPTALTEETEAAGLSRLVIPRALVAERGIGGSFDLSKTAGPVAVTGTLFISRVRHPVHTTRSPVYTIVNLPDPTTIVGMEALARVRREPFVLTASYTYVRARETADGIRQDVALTPRHSAGVVGMWEAEGRGRIGIEWYVTGRQRLEENPYRSTSRAYVILGVLAERQFGRLRLFVNGENLTGVRQTTWDPMLVAERAADGRWTVDAWAPLDGRTINGGIRAGF
jgi:iron complex outermembrane receptor protein